MRGASAIETAAAREGSCRSVQRGRKILSPFIAILFVLLWLAADEVAEQSLAAARPIRLERVQQFLPRNIDRRDIPRGQCEGEVPSLQ